ncbi:MAG TPA: VOC family protein [Acidimicrobiales bacterium]|jgi:predicted enzyme related to lactoylglutathione lyase|nr:VOC family protein [Acidimicrobiales bacterium]
MADPFEALRPDDRTVPVGPDPEFAASLLARLTRALSFPRGVTVSDLHMEETTTVARSGDIAYVSAWVGDVERAVAFYGSVLGWSFREAERPGSRQTEGVRPHHGVAQWSGEPTLFVCYLVDNLEEALSKVTAAGGTFEPPTDEPWGLTAQCRDNQGMALALYQPPAGQWPARWAVNGERQGDVSYVTMHVVDSTLAREFYGSVLGWTFSPGHVEDGWGPDDVSVMVGMGGGSSSMSCSAMYRVDDIQSAVERVRAAGGTATDPQTRPYGLQSECHDDQGMHFWLGQH